METRGGRTRREESLKHKIKASNLKIPATAATKFVNTALREGGLKVKEELRGHVTRSCCAVTDSKYQTAHQALPPKCEHWCTFRVGLFMDDFIPTEL